MRAVVFDRYGPPDVLRIEEVDRPVPKADEVLVRVHASTVTRSDCGLRGAEYFVARFFTGLFRPKRGRIGLEFAGDVESVGANVRDLAVGDRVFGICAGGNAEYVSEIDAVGRIPDGMSYEEAAALADGGLSALSLLRSAGLHDGHRIVVHGASGSIGVGAVQVAAQLGAHVTAVCTAKNLELMRTLGASEVVDYQTEDFTRNGQTYDVILDAAGKYTFLRCRRSLAPDGMYVTTDPGFLWHDAAVSLMTRRAKLGIVRYTQPDIVTLTQMVEAGQYRPVIDRTYRLDEVVEAHRYVDTHQKTGNVVLTIE